MLNLHEKTLYSQQFYCLVFYLVKAELEKPESLYAFKEILKTKWQKFRVRTGFICLNFLRTGKYKFLEIRQEFALNIKVS